MLEWIAPVIIGIICIVLGILNMNGNISSLHSYHRHRVTEEDRIPFGKRVGLGTVICGGALSAFGICSAITHFTSNTAFTIIGAVLLAVGLIAGLAISFAAMVKYNKGIF